MAKIDGVNLASLTNINGLAAVAPFPGLKIDLGRTSGGTVSGWVPDSTYYVGAGVTDTITPPDTSGLTDPAPSAVYGTIRRMSEYLDESVHIPASVGLIPNTNYLIRLHIDKATFSDRVTIEKYPHPTLSEFLFDGTVTTTVVIFEFPAISDSSGDLRFVMGNYGGIFFAAVGLEILPLWISDLQPMANPSYTNNASMSVQIAGQGTRGSLSNCRIKSLNGGLPQGVTLSDTGLLSGTPICYRQSQVIVEGDSRTGAFGTEGVGWPLIAQSSLGDNFTIRNIGSGGNVISNMVTEYYSQALPFRDSAFAKDIYLLFGPGVNDLNLSRSVADVYADYVTIGQQAQADGFFVIVSTCMFTNTSPAQPNVDDLNTNHLIPNWATFADMLVDVNTLTILGNAGTHTPDFRIYDGTHARFHGEEAISALMVEAIHNATPNGAATSLTAPADFTFKVTCEDDGGSVAEREYTITITP